MHQEIVLPPETPPAETCCTFWVRGAYIAAGAYYGLMASTTLLAFSEPKHINTLFTNTELVLYTTLAGALIGYVIHDNKQHIANGFRGIRNSTESLVTETFVPILQSIYNNIPNRNVNNHRPNSPELVV
jgi:hypothetical protein